MEFLSHQSQSIEEVQGSKWKPVQNGELYVTLSHLAKQLSPVLLEVSSVFDRESARAMLLSAIKEVT